MEKKIEVGYEIAIWCTFYQEGQWSTRDLPMILQEYVILLLTLVSIDCAAVLSSRRMVSKRFLFGTTCYQTFRTLYISEGVLNL